MDSHKQAMYMKNRKGVDEHIRALPAPIVFQHQRIAQQIGVAQHRAFTSPCGATGVNDGSHILWRSLHRRVYVTVMRSAIEQTAAALIVEGDHVTRARLKCNFADPPEMGWRANHQCWFCVVNKVSDFALLVGWIQWQENMAAA